MSTAYSYERVSTGKQAATGTGLNRQHDAVALYCSNNNLTLDTSLDLTDRGLSAHSGQHITEGALGRFLSLATSKQLDPDPHLIVEAIDRLSRLEPLDGLRNVIFALADAGVTIHTLEDHQTYSKHSLNTDPAALIVLVVKIQQANDYSRRLSTRITASWDHTRTLIRQGHKSRPTHCPYWLDWDADTAQFIIDTDKTRYLHRLYDLAESNLGFTLLARALNQEGFKTPLNKIWSAANVRKTLDAYEPCGVRWLIQYEPRAVNGRKRLREISRERIDNYYPTIIPLERRAHVQALIKQRATNTGATGRRHQTSYIGQGITRCTCGTLAGHTRPGGKNRIGYIACRSRRDTTPCGNQGTIKANTLHAHILTRLSPDQLSSLLTTSHNHQSDISKQANAIGRLEASLAASTDKLQRLQSKVTEAALDDAALSLLKALQDAADLEQAQVSDLSEALSGAQSALTLLQQQPSALSVASELQPQIQELFTAVLNGTDTPAQRWTMHQALVRLQLSIHIDGNAKRCGLQIANGPIQWQPVSDLSGYALQKGLTGVVTTTDEHGITLIEYDLPPDPEIGSIATLYAPTPEQPSP